MGPAKACTVERIEPSDKLMSVTEKVLAQNNMILEINAKLLAVVSSPMCMIKTDDAK